MASPQIVHKLLNAGRIRRTNGDMMGALSIYELAEQAAVRCGDIDLRAYVQIDKSAVFFHQRDLNLARNLIENAIAEFGRDVRPSTLSLLHSSLGGILSALEEWYLADAHFDTGYQAAIVAGDKVRQANNLYGRAEALTRQEQLDQARIYFLEVLKIREELKGKDNPIRLGNVLNELAVIAFRQNEFDEASTLLRRSLTIRINANDLSGIAQSLSSLAGIEERNSNPRSALAHLLRSARLYDKIRSRIGTGEDSRAGFVQSILRVFQDILRLATELQCPRIAFWAIQRLQNRTFLDSLCLSKVSTPPTVAYKNLKKEHMLLQRLRNERGDINRTNEILSTLNSLYLKEILKEDAYYARWRMGLPMTYLRIKKIITEFGPGTVYVELFEKNDFFYIFLCHHDYNNVNTNCFKLHFKKSRNENICSRFDQIHYDKIWTEAILSKKLAPYTGGQGPMFVVPHGLLSRAPFHAISFGKGPLISNQIVRYLPHVGLLEGAPRNKHFGRGTKSAVIADSRGDLPAAYREGKRVGRWLNVEPRMGDEANLASFYEALATADIFHFAGHAHCDLDEPLNSGLIASDGLLTAKDISKIFVKSSLVVLNACESGVHSPGIGSELHGFARSLLLSGVTMVICTLWQVDDQIAEEFAEKFYERIITYGDSPDHAANYSQNNLFSNYRELPEAWAPFIIIG